MKKFYLKHYEKISLLLAILFIFIPVVIMGINMFDKPLIVRAQRNLDIWYQITFYLGLISIIFGLINIIIKGKSINKKGFIILSLVFLIFTFSFISTITSDYRDYAFYGTDYLHIGFITYTLFLGFYLNSLSINKKDYKLLGVLFVIVAFFLCLISFINTDLTYRLMFKTFMPYTGLFIHPNHFGYYLSIATIINIFLYIYEKNIWLKLVYFISMSIIFITFIANDTFGSYLAVAICLFLLLIFLAFKKQNKYALIVIILFILLSAIMQNNKGFIVYRNFNELFESMAQVDNGKLSDSIGTGRMKLWKGALTLAKDKPLIGYGPSSTYKLYPKVEVRSDVPHNFILEVLVFDGGICLILYISLIIVLIVFNIKGKNRINNILLLAMLSYLVSALFGNMTFYTSPYFCIIMGMLSSLVMFKEKANE